MRNLFDYKTTAQLAAKKTEARHWLGWTVRQMFEVSIAAEGQLLIYPYLFQYLCGWALQVEVLGGIFSIDIRMVEIKTFLNQNFSKQKN